MKVKILFVIGPQRTGTSWIYDQFKNQQQGIFLDRIIKENEFFFKPKYATQKFREKFLKRLSGKGEKILYIDVCSLYFGHIESIKRIIAVFPEAKFIYCYRAEEARRKSFEQHKEFNKYGSVFIGYNISEELYAKQAKFVEFEKSLIDIVDQDKLLRLNFNDLKEKSGEFWFSEITNFMDIELKYIEKGIVNASRKDKSKFQRKMYFFVRMAQKLKITVLIKKIMLKLNLLD